MTSSLGNRVLLLDKKENSELLINKKENLINRLSASGAESILFSFFDIKEYLKFYTLNKGINKKIKNKSFLREISLKIENLQLDKKIEENFALFDELISTFPKSHQVMEIWKRNLEKFFLKVLETRPKGERVEKLKKLIDRIPFEYRETMDSILCQCLCIAFKNRSFFSLYEIFNLIFPEHQQNIQDIFKRNFIPKFTDLKEIEQDGFKVNVLEISLKEWFGCDDHSLNFSKLEELPELVKDYLLQFCIEKAKSSKLPLLIRFSTQGCGISKLSYLSLLIPIMSSLNEKKVFFRFLDLPIDINEIRLDKNENIFELPYVLLKINFNTQNVVKKEISSEAYQEALKSLE